MGGEGENSGVRREGLRGNAGIAGEGVGEIEEGVRRGGRCGIWFREVAGRSAMTLEVNR